MPDNYFFPSFFVFILWGPYVPPDNRLNINLVNDKGRSKSGSVREVRAKESFEKKLDDRTTTYVERGFSTDQRIELEMLRERRLEIKDRIKESKIVGQHCPCYWFCRGLANPSYSSFENKRK